MVLAGAALLVLARVAPLSLAPGVRTFPEIAALVAETPGAIKCDPKIAHRAAFVSAKSISRAGLLDALGLKLVPDEKGRELMKATDEVQERKWAEDVRAEFSRRYARVMASALAADARGKGQALGDEEFHRYVDPLSDPGVTPAERREVADAWNDRVGRALVDDPKGVAAVRTLAAMPSEVPMEVFERGVSFQAVPLTALPEGTIAALRTAYPALQGGAGTMVVRTIRLVDDMRMVFVDAAIIDPAYCGPIDTGFALDVRAGRTPSGVGAFTTDLLLTETTGAFRMRGYRAFVEEARRGEAEGRALMARYLNEVPLPRRPEERASLSQIAAAWAAKGRDVVMELSPKAEETARVLDGKGLRAESDWSPRVVEGALVLRPLTRFLDARRRYPYAALRAYEEAKTDAVGAYVRFAGPGDRFDYVEYHGRGRGRWDGMATGRRIGDLVSPTALAQARSRATKTEPGFWTVSLADLPPAARDLIAEEMRRGWTSNANVVVHSPIAWAAFVRSATLRVGVDVDRTGAIVTVQGAPQKASDDIRLVGFVEEPSDR